MKKLVLDYASKNPEFNTALESLKQTYGTNDVNSEVLADISGQLFGNNINNSTFYSINQSFASEYDNWNQKSRNGSFIIGKTSNALTCFKVAIN